MYIIKNALRSITRSKTRNILIGVIILVIAITSTITLAIRNSANNLIDSYYEAYSTEATIGMARDNIKEKFNDNKDDKDSIKEELSSITLSEDEIKKYADSDYVSSYYYTASVSMSSDSIDKVSSDFDDKGENHNPGGREMPQDSGDFTLVGYNSYTAMSEFIDGTYTISKGSVSDDFDSNYCLINEELASENDLEVGDSITLKDSNDKEYKLVISGIYKDNDTSSSNDRMNMFSNSANKIITNINQVLKIDSSASLSPTYVLKDSDSLSKFKKEVEEKGLNENLEVQDNLDEVENKVSSISNVKTFATTFLIITLIIGAVILFVIHMINIRERKYEIGVLRTIGMSKSKLTLQFICEIMIVSLASLLLGAAIGAVCSVPISNHLLKSEIEESRENKEQMNKNFGMDKPQENNSNESSSSTSSKSEDKEKNELSMNAPDVEEVTEMNAVVDFKVVGELLLIGIVLTLLSSLSAMISIQRFSPLTILKERS